MQWLVLHLLQCEFLLLDALWHDNAMTRHWLHDAQPLLAASSLVSALGRDPFLDLRHGSDVFRPFVRWLRRRALVGSGHLRDAFVLFVDDVLQLGEEFAALSLRVVFLFLQIVATVVLGQFAAISQVSFQLNVLMHPALVELRILLQKFLKVSRALA